MFRNRRKRLIKIVVKTSGIEKRALGLFFLCRVLKHIGWGFLVSSKSSLLRYYGFLVIACKCLFHQLAVWLWCKQADYGNDNQSGNHGDGATVDRRLHDWRQYCRHQHINDHDHRTEDEAYPAGDLSGLFPV